MVEVTEIRREEDVMTQTPTSAPPTELRDRALEQLKKKRAFYGHLLVYVLVNATIVVVWAMTSAGFFWPIFPMLGWGIGVIMNAWDVWRGDFTDDQIAHEMERLQRRR
jgi:cytochrome b561